MNNPFGADIYVDSITFNDGNVIKFGKSDIIVFTVIGTKINLKV